MHCVCYGLQGTASTTPPINGNAKSAVSVNTKTVSVDITFARFPPHIFGLMPTTNKTTPPGRSSPDQAKEQTDAARRRARQSIREHELIWLLQQRLRASQCLGLTGACAACIHCTATAWELSDLDHSHAATPQRITRASCAQLLRWRSDFCAWRRLLLICWKLLIGVCTSL